MVYVSNGEWLFLYFEFNSILVIVLGIYKIRVFYWQVMKQTSVTIQSALNHPSELTSLCYATLDGRLKQTHLVALCVEFRQGITNV